MTKLELIVGKEQVTGFMDCGFKDYMDDSQSTDSTWGITNYAYNPLSLLGKLMRWKSLMTPEYWVNHFEQLSKTLIKFKYSLQDIISIGGDRTKALSHHYDSLMELAITPEPVKLGDEDRCLDQLYEEVNTYPRRQIQISNILFDPIKRKEKNWKFQQVMWGGTESFIEYLDSLK